MSKRRKVTTYKSSPRSSQLFADQYDVSSIEYNETQLWQQRVAELVVEINDMFDTALMLQRMFTINTTRINELKNDTASSREELVMAQLERKNIIKTGKTMRTIYNDLKKQLDQAEHNLKSVKAHRRIMVRAMPTEQEDASLIKTMEESWTLLDANVISGVEIRFGSCKE